MVSADHHDLEEEEELTEEDEDEWLEVPEMDREIDR